MNGRWNNDVYSIPVKAGEIRRPAWSFTFIDEEETLSTGGAFVLAEWQENLWWMVPGSRDRGNGANVAFADGHAEFHPWKWPHRIRKATENPIVNELDREDLRWQLSRVPGAR
jgi:prepilin-type processing-associated H-X9-DG protein